MDKPKVFKTQKFFGMFFLIALASLLPLKTCLAEVIGGSGGYYYSSEACEYEVLNQDANGMLWGGTGYEYFYCCDADVSNKHESCPRWIVASRACGIFLYILTQHFPVTSDFFQKNYLLLHNSRKRVM